MKILYRQNSFLKSGINAFATYGINNCYFKFIKKNATDKDGTKNRHSHNGLEFHIMIDGCQTYEVGGRCFSLEGGNILALGKGISHSLVSAEYPITKYAFTFSINEDLFNLERAEDCVLFPMPERIISNIRTAEDFHKENAFGDVFVENIVFETVFLLLDELGINPKIVINQTDANFDERNVDERVELAIQFIKDNIESPLQVGEVASYCYISEKQLGRLFLSSIGISVADYIRRERLSRLEELLLSTDMPLSQISERFGFPSEHGFNVFFKKYNGMPPGEYRKMNGRG